MATIHAIDKLFDAVKTNNCENALKELKSAQDEIKLLDDITHINKTGRWTLESIRNIIKLVSVGNIQGAKNKYANAEHGYNGHLKVYLTNKLKEIKEVAALPDKNKQVNENKRANDSACETGRTKQSAQDSRALSPKQPPETWCMTEEQGPEDVHISTETRDTKPKESPKTTISNEGRHSRESNNLQLKQESKRASQALRMNNPNIADLSDMNRPTKVAERFSELYDNEWTEAFEELKNKKNKKEEDIIKYLLTIVRKAYGFCADKAEAEISMIVKAMNRILEFGTRDYLIEANESMAGVSSDESKGLIIQYRKDIASTALPRLQKSSSGKIQRVSSMDVIQTEFKENVVRQLNTKFQLPVDLKAVNLYAEKAIELTWWMCVQDPPVFMCPTDDSTKPQVDISLYKAYTKTGTIPDYFVWPALRLYKEGGVLMKGVLQYT